MSIVHWSRRLMRRMAFFPLAMLATPASADGLRDLCADRPGLGTPACIVDRGHVQVETGLADWTMARDAGTRSDTMTLADTLVRVGLTDSLEARIGWTPFGHQRERDRASGAIDRTSGIGDLTLGAKQSLMNPDGSHTSIALLPFVSLPTGGKTIGAGDWGAGVAVPVNLSLPGDLTFELTPEVDAAVDEDRRGRHLAFGSVIGVEIPLGKAVNVTPEVSLVQDDDPQGHETHALAGLSLAWQRGNSLQLDAGANLGLNRASDDVELYVGIARRF